MATAPPELRDADVVKPRTRLFIAGAGAVATTANAIRPIGRGRLTSMPAFALGLGPSEFPLHTGLLHLAIGGLLSRSGGTRGWRGKLGIAAHAASVAGLVAVYRTARRAGDVFDAALVEELGSDDRSHLGGPFTPKPEAALTRRQLVAPEMRMRRRYRSARDVSYGDFGLRNQLDVWKRSDLGTDARAPVLFQVHGGAWTMGRKEGQGEPLMAHLAERGWVCVTANYRLSPRATWPDHIVDVKRALAWTKANIAGHGGDPSFVVITGGSAGGHLCSLAALTPDLADFQPGFEDADTSVAAAVPFYGVYDFTNGHGADNAELERFLAERVFKSTLGENRSRWEQASPISHVGPHAPPFFVLHGTNDSLVPIEQPRAFVDELRKSSKQPVV
jgi:acetyl esterase/lipase